MQPSCRGEKDEQRQITEAAGWKWDLSDLFICSRAHGLQRLSFCVFATVLSIFKAPRTKQMSENHYKGKEDDSEVRRSR